MNKPIERVDVAIHCDRCHSPKTYSMLPQFAEIRQQGTHGNICNICLTTDEKKNLILELGATSDDILSVL